MRRAAIAVLLLLAGCGGDTDPELDQPATLVVTMRIDGTLAIETFAVTGGRLRPATLTERRVYARAGDEEPEEGISYEEIYLREADGTVRRLTRNRRADLAPQLLRDGRVAFLACVFREDEPPRCTLESLDPGTGVRKTLLTELGIVFDGELSPDESRYLFTRLDERSGVSAGLFVRDLPGGVEERLLDGDGGTWSPDGERIAFVSDRDENGRCLFHDCVGHAGEIYVADADGSDERRLTRNPQVDAAPEWSGDGEWIVFARIPDEEADWDLHAVRADGACERRLTDTGRWEIAAEWHGGGHGGLSC